MGGPVRLNGVAVDGYVVAGGGGVRVSADEADRLGLVPGQQVRVGWPGRDLGTLLLAAADREPPVVWLVLRPLASRAEG